MGKIQGSYIPLPTADAMINIQTKNTAPTIQKLKAAYQQEPIGY